MSSRVRISIVAFSLAALAGCASTPLPVRESPPAQQPQPPASPIAVAPVIAPNPNPQTATALELEETLRIQVDEQQDPVVFEAAPIVAEPDLWMRIRSGFKLAELDSPLIADHEKWYGSRPDYVARMTERSQRYLFHIVAEVERRGLPTEIALLPMIESAFNPTALSRSSAAGIWQFIPSTGKHFGLDQNWWYDGRRNVLAATNAALDYLQKLYGMFGSWELALAAYNCGEGTVSRAIAANRAKGLPTDYLSLKLPPETRHYVPKLMAVKNIVANPASFGVTLSTLPNKPFFTTVEINKHIDVALAARFADMTREEFVALNPAYNKPVITHNDNEVLLLPTTKVAMFKANMQRYGNRQLHSWQAYQGRRGERLDKIAKAYDISVAHLRSLNAVQEKKGKLKMAQLLLVPLKLAKPLPTAAQIAATTVTPIGMVTAAPQVAAVTKKNVPQTYVVQKGDTLYNLAGRFDTSVEALRNRNRLNGGAVKVGDSIEIPATTQLQPPTDHIAAQQEEAPIVNKAPFVIAASVSPTRETQPTRTAKPAARTFKPSFYTVKRGDSLYSIAQAFEVAVNDLKRWNKMSGSTRLMPGRKIKVVSGIH
ncbi:MAG TPA: LysM peptidoglycan-binding domain-containing protein [Burkholderiales bacterium]|nr:LysM peptidoglycan-binding domain-containing protein [Burkholderiales bacterium]